MRFKRREFTVQTPSETILPENNFFRRCLTPWIYKHFSLWQKGNQCTKSSLSIVQWPTCINVGTVLLSAFYLSTTTSRESKKPLHTTPGYGFNRRSHQPNFLLKFLSVHLSRTQADFKDPSHIFSWWPVICPPSQAPNFQLNHNPFPSQALSVPCLHNTLTATVKI